MYVMIMRMHVLWFPINININYSMNGLHVNKCLLTNHLSVCTFKCLFVFWLIHSCNSLVEHTQEQ